MQMLLRNVVLTYLNVQLSYRKWPTYRPETAKTDLWKFVFQSLKLQKIFQNLRSIFLQTKS